jgi:hypothetical protein
MSYNVPLGGALPMQTVNVGSNVLMQNVSINNISATNATIDNLKTAIFSPNTLNTSVINASAINLPPDFIFPVLNVTTLNSTKESFVNTSIQNLSANIITAGLISAPNVQETLIAGDNINISGNTISASGSLIPSNAVFSSVNASVVNASNISTGSLDFGTGLILQNNQLRADSIATITQNSTKLVTSGAVFSAFQNNTNNNVNFIAHINESSSPYAIQTIRTTIEPSFELPFIKTFHKSKLGNNALITVSFQFNYSVGGTNGDNMTAIIKRISPFGTALEVCRIKQTWNNGSGGGTRSSALSPITGTFVSDYNVNAVFELQVVIRNDGSDDDFTFIAGSSAASRTTCTIIESLPQTGLTTLTADTITSNGNLTGTQLFCQPDNANGKAFIGKCVIGNDTFSNMMSLSLPNNQNGTNYAIGQVANNETIVNCAVAGSGNSFRIRNVEGMRNTSVGLSISPGAGNRNPTQALDVVGNMLLTGSLTCNSINTAQQSITNLSSQNISVNNITINGLIQGVNFSTANLIPGNNISINSSGVISSFFGSTAELAIANLIVDDDVQVFGALNVSETSRFQETLQVENQLILGKSGALDGHLLLVSQDIGSNYTLRIRDRHVISNTTNLLDKYVFKINNASTLIIEENKLSMIGELDATIGNFSTINISNLNISFLEIENVSVENISVENVSAEEADIVILTSNTIVADTGDFTTLKGDVVNSTTGNFSSINFSSIGGGGSGSLSVPTANASTINASTINASVVNGDNLSTASMQFSNGLVFQSLTKTLTLAVPDPVNTTINTIKTNGLITTSVNTSNINISAFCTAGFITATAAMATPALNVSGTIAGITGNFSTINFSSIGGGASGSLSVPVGNVSTLNASTIRTLQINVSDSFDHTKAMTITRGSNTTDFTHIDGTMRFFNVTPGVSPGLPTMTLSGNTLTTRVLQNQTLMETANFSTDNNISCAGHLSVANSIQATTTNTSNLNVSSGSMRELTIFGDVTTAGVGLNVGPGAPANISLLNSSEFTNTGKDSFFGSAIIPQDFTRFSMYSPAGEIGEIGLRFGLDPINDSASIARLDLRTQFGNISTFNILSNNTSCLTIDNTSALFYNNVKISNGTINSTNGNFSTLNFSNIGGGASGTLSVPTGNFSTIKSTTANISNLSSNTIRSFVYNISDALDDTEASVLIRNGNITEVIHTGGVIKFSSNSINTSVGNFSTINASVINSANLSTAKMQFTSDFSYSPFSNTLALTVANPAGAAIAELETQGLTTVAINTSSFNASGTSNMDFLTVGGVLNTSNFNAFIANISTLNTSTINSSLANLSVIIGDSLDVVDLECDNISGINASFTNITATSITAPNVQPTLIAGDNISIVGNTISSAGSALPSNVNFSIVNTSTLNSTTANISTCNVSNAFIKTTNTSTLNSSSINSNTINATHYGIVEASVVNASSYLGGSVNVTNMSVNNRLYANLVNGGNVLVTNVCASSFLRAPNVALIKTLNVSTINASVINGYQQTLTAGTNISILNNVISSTGGTLPADANFSNISTINLSATNITATNITAPNVQPTLTAGTNINISNNVISASQFVLPADVNFSNISTINLSATNITATSITATNVQPTLTAGTNINISNNVISASQFVLPADVNFSNLSSINISATNITATNITAPNVQPTLTAGTNINISNNVISASQFVLPSTANFSTINTSTLNASVVTGANLSTATMQFNNDFVFQTFSKTLTLAVPDPVNTTINTIRTNGLTTTSVNTSNINISAFCTADFVTARLAMASPALNVSGTIAGITGNFSTINNSTAFIQTINSSVANLSVIVGDNIDMIKVDCDNISGINASFTNITATSITAPNVQQTLIAGTNITIVGNTISSAGGGGSLPADANFSSVNTSTLTADTSTLATINSSTISVINTAPSITLTTSTGGSGRVIFGNSNHGVGRGLGISTLTDGNDVVLHTAGTGSIGLITSGIERMRINSAGKIIAPAWKVRSIINNATNRFGTSGLETTIATNIVITSNLIKTDFHAGAFTTTTNTVADYLLRIRNVSTGAFINLQRATFFFNQANIHLRFSNSQVNAVTPGTYDFQITRNSTNVRHDTNDRFSVLMFEFPFD